MSTGFGYVRDSKPNIINWADIGKKMSDSLELEIKDRQKRKDDINANLGKFSSQLLDQPQGAYAEANRFISDFSQQASQQALRDLQALKSGNLSEQEYYQRRANLKSGTDLMFKAGKLFNENYSQAMKRIQDGSASVLEADLKAKMEGYINFAKSGAYINPLTGTVNVSVLDENGNVSSRRGDFMDASELVKLSSETFDNYKLDEKIKSISDSLGKVTLQDSRGRLTTLSSLDKEDRQIFNDEIDAALKNEVDSIVGGINSKVAASILADHSGEDYSLTFDINNTDKNKIIYDPNGNVQLTEDQLNKAKEIVKNKLLNSFDRTIKEPQSKTSTTRNLTGTERQADSVYRLAYNLTTGFETDTTLKKIAGLRDDIDQIVDGEQEYIIQFKRDPKTGVIPNNKIIPKIFTDDVFDAEESAVALTRAIDSRIDLGEAENAKDRYFKSNKKRNVTPGEGFGELKVKSLSDIYSVQDANKTNKNRDSILKKLENIEPDEGREPDIKKVIDSMPDGKEKQVLQSLTFISNDPGPLGGDNLIISNIPDNIFSLLTEEKLKTLGIQDPKRTKGRDGNLNKIEIDYESESEGKSFAALLNEIIQSSNVRLDAFGNVIL
tara:strand:+ start:1999 stop:3825 length:1827 start_codon:yes stop_codon:yes gene_type:complete